MAATGTAIEVEAVYFATSFVLDLTAPVIEIDGTSNRGRWGTNRYDVSPGRHTLTVYFRYGPLKRAGKNSIEVDVSEGQVQRVQYRAPWAVFKKGKLTAESVDDRVNQ